MMKKLKDNQNKNFTTDANGNILLIKGTGADRLQSEFFVPKVNILEKAIIPSGNMTTINGKLENKENLNSRLPSSNSKILQKLPLMPKGLGFPDNSNIINTNVTNFLLNVNNINIARNSEVDKDKMVSILPAGSSFE